MSGADFGPTNLGPANPGQKDLGPTGFGQKDLRGDRDAGSGDTAAIDLSVHQRIHVVGAGGAGMSAIATVLAAMGHEVTGSDLKASSMFRRLAGAGLRMTVGHDPANVAGASALAVSSAVPDSNVEVAEARRLNIPVFARAAVLANIATLRRTIAVAGTHGKTTTASMLSLILVEAGLRPSFIIGGDVNDIGTNAVWDTGEWLVVEADESDKTFLRLAPEVAIVTNVEPDHLDTYGSFEALKGAFADFMAHASACVVLLDDPVAAEIAASMPVGLVTTFGQSAGARYRLSEITGGRSSVRFSLSDGVAGRSDFEVAVPGAYNARNATAAIVAAGAVGVDADTARRALARFAGVARRFEFRGEKNGVTFIDDYAHLPTEVRSVLAAAKNGGYERVVCVFQPHRYSRMAALAPDFADAFVDADLLFVTDIYNSGEASRPGVTGRLIVDAVLGTNPEADVTYTETHERLLSTLRQRLSPGDCCITLEAGDLTSLPDELLADDGW
jgi:UDP-N-acetylmuramate--alanine ligase